MSAFPMWLNAVAIFLIALVFLIGIGSFLFHDAANKFFGHTDEGAPAVLGTRSFFLGALGAFYLYLGNAQALAVLLGLGVIASLWDAAIESRHGAHIYIHVLAAIAMGINSYLFYQISVTGTL